jgi:hypothetical protein
VMWRTAAFHEGTYRPAYACTLELGERHSSQALPATAAKAAIPPPAGNRDKLLRLHHLMPSTMRKSRSAPLPSARSAS